MAQPSELEQLVERRRQLVAQSSDLRTVFARDFGDLKSSAVWIERGYSWVTSGRTLWPCLAGAAGLALAYRKRGWLGTTQKLVSAFQLARKIGAVVKTFVERPQGK